MTHVRTVCHYFDGRFPCWPGNMLVSTDEFTSSRCVRGNKIIDCIKKADWNLHFNVHGLPMRGAGLKQGFTSDASARSLTVKAQIETSRRHTSKHEPIFLRYNDVSQGFHRGLKLHTKL